MRRYGWLAWFVLDLVLVVVFAASGRSTHEESVDVLGTLGTAAPFLIALTVSTLATRGWKTINDVWPWGFIVWAGTVALGLGLRLLMGSTAAWPFVLVTTGTLALFLIGRRAVAGLLIRNRVKLRG